MELLLYIVQLLLLGVGVGLVSAALGLGGGILMVPAFLAFVPGMDAHTAKGTSLFIIIFVALLNAWRLNAGVPDKPWRLAFVLATASIAGSYFGAWITTKVSDEVVLWLFMLLLVVLAIRTFLLKSQKVDAAQVRTRDAVAAGIGGVAGVAGGATGTGGGAVLIPLALIAGIIENRRVVGLSNIVMVFTSAAGTVAHLQAEQQYAAEWTIGHVYLPLAPLVFLGAQIGSPPGKKLNHLLTLRRRRVAMGVMLLLIAAQMLYKIYS